MFYFARILIPVMLSEIRDAVTSPYKTILNMADL
jgi:hypothetical protein